MVRPYIFEPGLSDSTEVRDEFTATLSRVGDVVAGVTRMDAFVANIALASGMGAAMIRVDSEEPHYLEVSPQVTWVVDGWTYNDVFSDITWFVED